jgi:hypothetical protein
MKKIFYAAFITIPVFACSVKKPSVTYVPVHSYEISYDDGKVFKGLLKRSDIENDTTFKWFKPQNLVPVFYRLVDKAGYPDENITLIGVDRDKTTLDNLSTAFNIINVPTFIVMQDGKEVGRVVEYGKYGEIDKELGEIVAGL